MVQILRVSSSALSYPICRSGLSLSYPFRMPGYNMSLVIFLIYISSSACHFLCHFYCDQNCIKFRPTIKYWWCLNGGQIVSIFVSEKGSRL